MTDWAAWGTSVGTLALAGATFATVRSSNRSARIAERALMAGQRPLLTPSRPEDHDAQVQFADGRVFAAGGGEALVREDGPVVYLAVPLRAASPRSRGSCCSPKAPRGGARRSPVTGTCRRCERARRAAPPGGGRASPTRQ